MKTPSHSLVQAVICLHVACACVACAQSNCLTAPSGLISWWRAETNALDAVGGNHGLLTGGVVFTNGVVGRAFDFSVVAGAKVSVPDAPVFKLTNALTIEGWFYPKEYNGLIVFRGDNRSGLDAWQLDAQTPGKVSFKIFDQAGGAGILNAPFVLNQWQHIAASWDATTGMMRLYTNGVLATQTTTPIRPSGELNPSFQPAVGIGNHGGTFHQFPFIGLIDEISIYNRALPESEVFGIYTAGADGKCQTPPACSTPTAGIVSWWRAETNALDAIDGNHGTLVGNATYGPGRVGRAFVLDGNNDGVLVGTATNLQLQDFSIEAWIKRSSTNVISFNGNGGAEIFALGAGGGGFGFYLRPDALLAFGKLQVSESTSTVRIRDTNWHHVAVTKSGASVVFYLDGTNHPAAAPFIPGRFSYSGPGYIGAWRNPSGIIDNSFYGSIDELAFYNRPLTSGEILSIFNAGATGKCPNRPPVATPQSVAVPEDSSLVITLGGVDPDLQPLTYTIVRQPTNGILTGMGTNRTYTPAANYFGPDHFTFKVNDGVVDSQVAEVRIQVIAVPDVPVAVSQSIATDEDTALPIILGASDADGDSLTFRHSSPAHGTLTGTPPNVTYTPVLNYFGPDSFTFAASDAISTSLVATVSITVRPINDPPVAVIKISPLTQVLDITNKVVVAGVCSNATVILNGSSSYDVENDPLKYLWTEGTNSLGTVAVLTNPLPVGTHWITLTVNDGSLNGVAYESVEVVSPAQALGIIAAYVESSNPGRATTRPFLASLGAAAASFENCRIIPGVNQLKAFQNKVRAQIAPSNPELANKLIEATQQVIDAILRAP